MLDKIAAICKSIFYTFLWFYEGRKKDQLFYSPQGQILRLLQHAPVPPDFRKMPKDRNTWDTIIGTWLIAYEDWHYGLVQLSAAIEKRDITAAMLEQREYIVLLETNRMGDDLTEALENLSAQRFPATVAAIIFNDRGAISVHPFKEGRMKQEDIPTEQNLEKIYQEYLVKER